jgi:hypothetical protein
MKNEIEVSWVFVASKSYPYIIRFSPRLFDFIFKQAYWFIIIMLFIMLFVLVFKRERQKDIIIRELSSVGSSTDKCLFNQFRALINLNYSVSIPNWFVSFQIKQGKQNKTKERKSTGQKYRSTGVSFNCSRFSVLIGPQTNWKAKTIYNHTRNKLYKENTIVKFHSFSENSSDRISSKKERNKQTKEETNRSNKNRKFKKCYNKEQVFDR